MSWLPFCPCHAWQTLLSLFSLKVLLILVSLGLFGLLALVIFLRLTSDRYPRIVIHNSERYYLDPRSGERHPLPALGTILLSKDTVTYGDLAPATLYLSVIVPAYNEEERLPVMLDEALN